MRLPILLLFVLLRITSVTSQINLVPNPGFENHTNCPNFGSQWNYCSNWNNVNMNVGVGNWGTPDYFHSCGSGGVVPPSTFAGTCNPHTGDAMMAEVVYNIPYPDYREYLGTQLNSSMIPGITYTASFWITNGTGIISPWTISNIGICFSTAPLSQVGYGLINVVPQFEVSVNIASTSWTKYTFTINPTTTFNYITIGAFRTDGLNSVTQTFPNPGGPPSSYANYFFDDIEVIAPEITNTSKPELLSDVQSNFQLYPNPSNDGRLYLNSLIPYFKIEVSNILGELVRTFEYKDENAVLDVSDLIQGNYFFKIYFKETQVVRKVLISK